MIKAIINFFKKLISRYKAARLYAKAKPQMEKALNQQIKERKQLRVDINIFLKKYFGIDANSKYIPKDYKNKEEVKVAIVDKFGKKMDSLNVTYEKLFR